MTSEPDNKPGRRPPTIELKAEEVGKPAGNPPGPDAPGAQSPGARAAAAAQASLTFASGLKPYALSALAGAIAMATIVGLLWVKGIMPAREPGDLIPSIQSGPETSVTALAGAAGETASTQAGKDQPPSGGPQPLAASPADDAALDTRIKPLSNSLAALNHRLDDVAAASQGAAGKADAAQASANAAKNAAQKSLQRSDIDTLVNRVATLEAAVKALADNAAHSASGIDDRAARLTVAAEALRAAVERGALYQAELGAVEALGADRNSTAPLAPYAANGVPSASALARDLAALVPALRRATDTVPGDVTFLGRLEANARQLVRITPVDAPAGNDPASIIVRINADAAHADIAAALADLAALPDTAKPLAADWVKKAQARDAAMAASREIAAAALAALSRPAGQ